MRDHELYCKHETHKDADVNKNLTFFLSKLQLCVACMTGALWAKRGERDISRGARDEGKRKIC